MAHSRIAHASCAPRSPKAAGRGKRSFANDRLFTTNTERRKRLGDAAIVLGVQHRQPLGVPVAFGLVHLNEAALADAHAAAILGATQT